MSGARVSSTPYALVLALAALLPATAMAERAEEPSSPALKERIARLALKQAAFGAVSLLPVTFAGSGLAGPIADGGRSVFCVSTRMKGRAFGRAERRRAAMRYEADRLTMLPDDDACAYHRARPFPELEALGNAR